MQKIRILHIIKSLGRGGAEVLLPETLELHDKNIFDFHYIYFLPWKDQMVQAIKDARGHVTCFPSNNNIALLLQKKKVAKYCKDNHIDIIHCHLPWSGFLGRTVHKSINIPLLYTEHNIQEKYHFLTRLLNKLTFNYQTMVFGVSHDVSKSIQVNIKPNVPVNTLLNGVNTEKFQRDKKGAAIIREQYNIPLDAVVMGNVAVFREQKNIPLWLKVFKEISTLNPGVYGLLVGTGPKKNEIKNLISELGLEKKIILTGQQTNTLPYFSAMDIFMMSSDFEGLPVALLEAMSAECAVVATKAGGVEEVITHEQDGLLSETGNEKELLSQSLRLVEDRELREKIQSSARERIKENFSLGRMVNSLEEFYLKFGRSEF